MIGAVALLTDSLYDSQGALGAAEPRVGAAGLLPTTGRTAHDRVPGAPANLAFQTEEIYERSTWPATTDKQQMMLHQDIGVTELVAAVKDAVELGAALSSHQPQEDVRVLLDPAGHPFCLHIDRDEEVPVAAPQADH